MIGSSVTPGEDSEAEDGITESEHDAEGTEDADQLVGDDVNPDDGEDEAGNSKELVVDGGPCGPGGNNDGFLSKVI